MTETVIVDRNSTLIVDKDNDISVNTTIENSLVVIQPTINSISADIADTNLVTQTNFNSVVVSESQEPLAVTVVSGISAPSKLVNLVDLELEYLQDGSVLVYKSVTQKWEATNLLNQQTIEAGQF